MDHPRTLAIPSSENSALPARTCTDASFGRVSVVMIVWANCCAACSVVSRPAIRSGNLCEIFRTGSGTPMIPVEEEKYFSLGFYFQQRGGLAAHLMAGSDARLPAGAVGVVPEFITTARTRPRVFVSDGRANDSGAATTRFLGEYGCGGGRDAAAPLDQCEIRTPAGLDAGSGGGK